MDGKAEALTGFRSRLEKVVERAGGQAELHRRTGVALRSIGNYLRGETEPKDYVIAKLAEGGGVCVEWLQTGAGPMTLEGRTAAEPHAGYAYVPLLDVRARGGVRGAVVEGERVVDALAFKEDWIRQELRVSPSDLRLIYVEGDSMEPDLRPGDIILIDHTDTAARREGIYVLRVDGALLVKQLQRLPGGVIKVLSRNEAYEPFSVRVDELEQGNDIAIIGRVVWACRRY